MPIDTYRACGEVGNVGTPGAPIMTYSLLVVAGSELVSGHVEIRQALPPPHKPILVQVTGNVHIFGPPPGHRVVTLAGTYLQSFPPPAIGEILEHFSAVLFVNSHWDGHGSFSYGGHTVTNVPVKSHPCA